MQITFFQQKNYHLKIFLILLNFFLNYLKITEYLELLQHFLIIFLIHLNYNKINKI